MKRVQTRLFGMLFGVLLTTVVSQLVGCADPEPRYGQTTLSASAPRATFSGTTFGASAAMELAPGCPGYLDIETPGHVVHVTEDLPFDISVRSADAPLALAVAHGDEVRCDSDEGSGHVPTLSFEEAGEYLLFVAALREPAELAYEVTVAGGDARRDVIAAPLGDRVTVNVTITSQPPGAEVRDAEGTLVGTTPAMFVQQVDRDQLGQPRTWTLTLEGHESVTVTGDLSAGAMLLHGHLPEDGPTEIVVAATEPVAIRDYQRASLGVDVVEACEISDAQLQFELTHSFVGDLRIILQTPWEEEITLHRHTGGGSRNLRRSWSSRDPQLRPLLGRSTRGRWLLVVHDDAGADEGMLNRFELRLRCGPQEVAVAPPPRRPRRPSRRTPHVRLPQTQPSVLTVPAIFRTPPTPRVPDLPTRSDIVRALGAVRGRVEQCGTGQGGSVRVIATVSGSTGRVTGVSSTGVSDAHVRSCVHRAVRAARFSRFRRGSLDVDYTYALR